MSLRQSNRTRIGWFLDRDWPDRIQGSPDPEQHFSGKKSEGRVILRKAAYDSIDAHYLARLSVVERQERGVSVQEQEIAQHFAQSHKVMLYLIDEYMPEYHPNLDRVARAWVLNESVAGGMVELRSLQRQAEMGNPYAGAIAETIEWWIERMLDVLDYWGFRLFVAKDEAFESKIQERNIVNNQQRVLRAQETYEQVYGKLMEVEEEFPEMGREQAKDMLIESERASKRDLSRAKINRAIAHCEKKSEKTPDEP